MYKQSNRLEAPNTTTTITGVYTTIDANVVGYLQISVLALPPWP
jgi:hypothetical protein